jgi:hypothetical protein
MPPAMLCAVLGLALAFAPRRAWGPSVATLVVTAAALAFLPLPHGWLEGVFVGCWISVSATAASVHLPRGLSLWGAVSLSLNAGVWAGSVVALAGSPLDLFKATPCVLAFLPAAWMVAKRFPIIVKILSSWLIAVAILALILQFLPVTPGYMPDHLD